jgi:hypothetical protein
MAGFNCARCSASASGSIFEMGWAFIDGRGYLCKDCGNELTLLRRKHEATAQADLDAFWAPYFARINRNAHFAWPVSSTTSTSEPTL